MALQDQLDSPLAHAVRKAGSQAAFARIVGKSQPAIHDALRRNAEIDLEDVPAIERALGIPRHQLRPDYFEAPLSPGHPPQHPVGQPPASSSCPARGEGAGGSGAGTGGGSGAGTGGGSGTDPLEGLAA